MAFDLLGFLGNAAGAANPVQSAIQGGVSGIFDGIKTAVGAFKADPTKMAELEHELREAELQHAVLMSQAQTKINEIEAANQNLFVSGWRPALGWVCDVALGVYYIPRFGFATLIWVKMAWSVSAACNPAVPSGCLLPPMPDMGVADILGLVGTLLGSSWIRYQEKKDGVAHA